MLKSCEWSAGRDYKTGTSDEPMQFYLNRLANTGTLFSFAMGARLKIWFSQGSEASIPFLGTDYSRSLSPAVSFGTT